MQFHLSVDYMNKTQSDRLQDLKNKEKVYSGNPKSGGGRLRELFILRFRSQFKRGFTKVVVTRTLLLINVSGRKESFRL